MAMQKRCAIYTRISTTKQETENQLKQLTDYAEKQNWQVVKIYKDEGISGGKGERPALKQLLENARKRKFDILLFWSLDRFSREGVLKTVLRLNELEAYDIKFVSYTEPYLSSLGHFRDAVVALLAALAKQEQIRMSERVKAGLTRAKSQGVKLGRPKIELDVDEVLRLRRRGFSFRQIAKRLGCSKSKIGSFLASIQDEKGCPENLMKTRRRNL